MKLRHEFLDWARKVHYNKLWSWMKGEIIYLLLLNVVSGHIKEITRKRLVFLLLYYDNKSAPDL